MEKGNSLLLNKGLDGTGESGSLRRCQGRVGKEGREREVLRAEIIGWFLGRNNIIASPYGTELLRACELIT